MTTIRKVKPVRPSTLHKKAERYQDGFVKVFREHEGAQVLNEDGTEMQDGRGRVFVTLSWFANEFGIDRTTFRRWMGRIPTPDNLDDLVDADQTAECSCIPDPGCPVHGEGVNHGSPLEDSYA